MPVKPFSQLTIDWNLPILWHVNMSRKSPVNSARIYQWTLLLIVSCRMAASAQTVPSANQDPLQSTPNPQSSSPSDLSAAAQDARQARDHERSQRSAGSEAVKQMADELAEGPDQPIAGAPVGYRYYVFKPGNYTILVPEDAQPEAHDYYGLRLLSSELITSRLEVILGDPIPAQGDTPEEMLRNAGKRYFAGCNLNPLGLSPPLAGHPAQLVPSFSLCAMHNELLGSAEFVLADGFVMPIVCGYPYKPGDLDGSPNQPIRKITAKYDRERNGMRVCDLILPSVRFDIQQTLVITKPASAPVKKPEATTALLPSSEVPDNANPADTSLGAFARSHKKTTSTEALTDLKHSAPGFNPHSFRYCIKDECFSATLQVPVNARRNEQYRQDYIGLFEFDVPIADTTAVIEATSGAPTKLGFLTREQFINTKVDWWIGYIPASYFSGAGKAEIFSEELTTLSGIPARLATFRSPTALNPVVTHQAVYMAPGMFLQIRCSVAESASGDAQKMCEHVVHSLEVPHPSGQNGPESDGPSEDDDP